VVVRDQAKARARDKANAQTAVAAARSMGSGLDFNFKKKRVSRRKGVSFSGQLGRRDTRPRCQRLCDRMRDHGDAAVLVYQKLAASLAGEVKRAAVLAWSTSSGSVDNHGGFGFGACLAQDRRMRRGRPWRSTIPQSSGLIPSICLH